MKQLPGTAKLHEKLAANQPLRVLFINDVGFQYGAGIGSRRQIQSFLLMGCEVAALCCRQGRVEATVPLIPEGATGEWLGLPELDYLDPREGISQQCIIDNIVLEASLRYPDVIIVGNLHGVGWSLKLLAALHSLDAVVIAYMHDCYLLTGRCAYTGNCTLYEAGCDDRCPTWEEYPSLAPEKIFDEWVLRRELFCGEQGIPIATNSRWVLEMAEQALKGLYRADCLYLGLDEHLFQPIDQTLARQLLGIPVDRFVVLSGAVNVSDRRKGGAIFCQVVEQLQDQVNFLVFGAESHQLPGITGTGLMRDYRKMALVYSAADVFVGTALEEAFGQTLCEAAACGLPIVAFNVGGVPEIAQHNVNARLADQISAEALIEEIQFFQQNPEQRREFGQAGRAIVEAEFTLRRQGERWMDYLRSLAVNSHQALTLV
jgi:glycosyltransferase involved in cell wall biosynthesis